MSHLSEDLNDSALFCKSIVQKRKASNSDYPKSSKQLKLNFSAKATEAKKTKGKNYSEEDESQDLDGREKGCTSSYFWAKKTSNTCPLCLRVFKSDSAYSNHMKQCAKTHKMTTQQLLGALELQKKQMQERRDLGLCSQNVQPAAKKTCSKKKEENERDSYDLALGLAMSRSLGSSKPKGEALPEVQSTLNQFGIASGSAAEPWKRKNESNKKSVLKERTAEDRQRIIIEKVAVVLLDEEQESDSKRKTWSSNARFQNGHVNSLTSVVPQLWNLGENDGKGGWYVDGIKTLVFPSPRGGDEKTEPVSKETLESEISKLNLPQEEIHRDWKKMINNSKFSDVTGRTKDCQNFYLHSVVLCARRPEILEKEYEIVFRKHNLSTIVIFLEYLYCGTLNSLVREEMKDLRDLAEEFNYTELITVLNCLENNFMKPRETAGSGKNENEGKPSEKPEVFEEEDAPMEEDLVDLTQSSHGSAGEGSENESNAEKSYWSFMKHEREREELESKEKPGNGVPAVGMEKDRTSVEDGDQMTGKILNGFEEERDTDWRDEIQLEKIKEVERRESDDSATRDLDDAFKIGNFRTSTDCIVLSSGSESNASNNLEKLREGLRTPSPVHIDHEVPYYDPYDNFNWFSEDQFSPVNTHSQSLITGDVSSGSLKLGDAITETPKESNDVQGKESKENPGYCSTPVTMRHSFRVKSSRKESLDRSRKRRSDLSGSRILRKSLGLQLKARSKKSSAFQRKSTKRKGKDFAEVLTDSILNELSKSATFKSSTPVRATNFVEITPIPDRYELGESVTPSPNYSKMEETTLKEQLAKYGLKKNLGKNKARKILRHIYEELHPLYNPKTGKIVKILPSDTPKVKKKAKPKGRQCKANIKPKQMKNRGSQKSKQKDLNSSNESIMSDGSSDTLEGPTDNETDGSDMENLSETLTQTVASNPVDLPSAFLEFLENNPEYHRKILLYEPIWLEELQKKLKENFKKHFKIADLMDYLDQKCITFRSAAQAKNSQRKIEKKKKIAEKEKALPDI